VASLEQDYVLDYQELALCDQLRCEDLLPASFQEKSPLDAKLGLEIHPLQDRVEPSESLHLVLRYESLEVRTQHHRVNVRHYHFAVEYFHSSS
jgi:hypothetical protein